MNPITISLFFASKDSFKSFQYVAIKNPVEVTPEYAMKPHYKPEIGIAQINAVIRKLVNEYAYIPRIY